MRCKIGLGLKPVVRYYTLRAKLPLTELGHTVKSIFRLARLAVGR